MRRKNGMNKVILAAATKNKTHSRATERQRVREYILAYATRRCLVGAGVDNVHARRLAGE